MADIDIERKSSMAWIWWLLGAIVLALLIWMFAAGDDDDDEIADTTMVEAPVTTTPAVVPAPIDGAATTGIPFAEISQNPAAWAGRTVSGEVQVGEVPTDRGFWITSGADRMFVILGDGPQEQPADINTGQTLQLNGAVVHTPDQLGTLPGQIDADTRRIAEGQPALLFVDEANLNILNRG